MIWRTPVRAAYRQHVFESNPPPSSGGVLIAYGLRLVPPSQDESDDRLFAELRRVTTQRGARLHGWTVFLHNTTLGLAHPDVTQENCFGDRAASATGVVTAATATTSTRTATRPKASA